MTKKKLTSILIIGISLIIAAVVLITHKSDIAVIHSNELYIDDGQYQSIVSSRQPSEQPLTINISFDGQNLIYDSDTNSFYYSLINACYIIYHKIKPQEASLSCLENVQSTYQIIQNGRLMI